LAGEAARQRRQVHPLAERVGRKASPIEPLVQEAASRTGEMVAQPVGDGAGRLPDQQDAHRRYQRRSDRIGPCQVALHLAASAGSDCLAERGEVSLTVRRTRQYADDRAGGGRGTLVRGGQNTTSGSAPRTHWRRAAIVAGVGLLALAAAACDNPQTAWIPASDYANEGKDLFQYIIYAGIVVGVLVEGALIFAAIRFRRKPTDGLPPQIHGNTLVEVTWTTVPAIVLLTILVPTIQTIFRTQAPAPADSFQVHVVGHQFWWEF